ncbi:MAG: Coenzyme F420 hydrogenase/dehydrogenase, beta subunit C-terminal domain [Desulfovibrionaceae bacterium]
MKTFDDLIQEVCKPGLCHQCGGCVSFCAAANYGALEMGPDGVPRYRDRSRCADCGLCYQVCPEVDELVDETRARLNWATPIGPVEEVCMARARDTLVRDLATDGGVVTALLLHLLESGCIDGAVVSRQTAPLQRLPCLAVTRKDVLLAAGAAYAPWTGRLGEPASFSTYASSSSSISQLGARGVRRAAVVAPPDQIMCMRKMETMHIPPSDRFQYQLGLFCSRSFEFGAEGLARLEELGRFQWPEVERVNLKESLQFHLLDGRRVEIPLDRVDFLARSACRYCKDYSAELADISFGGLGAPEGWTTVIIRNGKGRKLFAEARGSALEVMAPAKMTPLRATALELIKHYSQAKRARGVENRKEFEASVA